MERLGHSIGSALGSFVVHSAYVGALFAWSSWKLGADLRNVDQCTGVAFIAFAIYGIGSMFLSVSAAAIRGWRQHP